MNRRKSSGAILGMLIVLAACDRPPERDGLPRFEDQVDPRAGRTDDAGHGDAGIQASADADVESGAPARRSGPQFAVINSDWTATSISLLDVNGDLVADNYLSSGSAPAGLVTALSGDVSLPTRSGETGVMVILDRYTTDVVTRIDLKTGDVLGQVKTHTPAGRDAAGAYSSNPHDYVYIAAHTAWLTRFEPNLDPQVPHIDRGTDLLRIDPSTMERSAERIDLSGLNTRGTRVDPDTGEEQEVEVFARPSRLVRLGDILVVGLARTSFDFSAVGPGMVALVDLETRAVEGFALEGLTSCSAVTPVVDAHNAVIVSCRGFHAPDPREGAGIARLTVADRQVEISALWRAKDHPELPVLGAGTVSLGGAKVAAGANEYSGKGPDIYMVLDLESGETQTLYEKAVGSGSIGSAHYDVQGGLLLLADSSVDDSMRPTGGVRRFKRGADGTFEELDMVEVARETAMPVRHVFPL